MKKVSPALLRCPTDEDGFTNGMGMAFPEKSAQCRGTGSAPHCF